MAQELNTEVLKTGTTTIGIVCKDAVVLAADMRATAGNMIVDHKAQKVHEITESIALTMAGSVSDSVLLVKLLKAETKLKHMRVNRTTTVKEVANLLSGMVYGNIRKMSMIPGISHFIVGGYDINGNGIYDIFPDGSVTEVKEYIASGSGSVFALGVLEAMYTKNMEPDDAVKLAVKAANAALRRDSASGDGLHIIVIDKDGIRTVKKEYLELSLKN